MLQSMGLQRVVHNLVIETLNSILKYTVSAKENIHLKRSSERPLNLGSICSTTQISSVQFSISVMSDSLQPPWTTACQASLSITNSQSLPKLMSIKSVIPSNHLMLCHPLFLLPSIFPIIRVFSNESALCIKRPKYWRFSFNISPSKEY